MFLPQAAEPAGSVLAAAAWTRGLSEADRALALDRARRIADETFRLPRESLRLCSLAAGWAGVALLHGALARSGDEVAGQRSLELAEVVASGLESEPFVTSLFDGSVGAAFALEHLRKNVLDDGPELLDDFDEELRAALDGIPLDVHWPGTFDLITGLAGLGVYALERPLASGAPLLERVIARLDACAEPRDGGLTWWTPSTAVSERARAALGENGYYNLGMAHGVPGVIAMLTAAAAVGVDQERARKLVRGAVTWLRRWRETARGPSLYPSWIYPDGTTQWARLAWCYGDPGVALALAAAARLESREDWWDDARTIARSAALVSFEASLVIDAGLCHGAFGLAQVFGRLHALLGEDSLGEAARTWLRIGFGMATPGEGFCDYRAWNRLPDGTDGWTDDPGLLSGATGVALVLAGAATSVDTGWDRMLLASWPPEAPRS